MYSSGYEPNIGWLTQEGRAAATAEAKKQAKAASKAQAEAMRQFEIEEEAKRAAMPPAPVANTGPVHVRAERATSAPYSAQAASA